MPGELIDRTDPDAPKTIVSKEINSFECEFSQRYYCRFSLIRQDDNALCTGEGYNNSEHVGFEFETTVPLEALDELQAIIDEHNLAALNGMHRTVQGLPEGQGGRLFIEYASGEIISANNNQFTLIGSEASLALFEFFSGYAKKAGHDFLLLS